MWTRKSNSELHAERKIRMKNYEIFILCLSFLSIMFLYWYVGTFQRLASLLKEDPELVFSLIILPLIIYLGYRSYVLHGKFGFSRYSSTAGKVCLNCGIGLGYGDDGWGFKSYGTTPKKWWQVKKCKTPEKCDIAYIHEVKWVEDKSETTPNVIQKNKINKDHDFFVILKGLGAIFIILLFAVLIVALPFFFGWLLIFLF